MPMFKDCREISECQSNTSFSVDNDNGMCCTKDCIKCNWDNVNGIQDCFQCKQGYELVGNNCFEICPSGQYRYPNNNCNYCDTANQQFIDNQNICQSCHFSCLTCDGLLQTSCLSCLNPKSLYPDHSCQYCNTNNQQYLDNQQICRSCDPSCQTCNGSLTTSCLSCPNGTYLHADGSCKVCNVNNKQFLDQQQICQNCDPSCLICNGLSNSNCLSCNSGYYQQGNYCIKCNNACSQCTGPTDSDCLQCNYSYFQIDSKRCIECSNHFYLNSSSQNCSICEYQCISCNFIKNYYSFLPAEDFNFNSNQDNCLVCNCITCQNGFIKYNNKQCTSSCDSIGNNYQYKSSTNTCECKTGYNYFVKNLEKNSFDCSQGIGFGYYCDQNNYCFQCSQNCNNCLNENKCLKCNRESYLWQNKCYPDCFPSLNIVTNIEQQICECSQGYTLKQIASPIQGQNSICQLPLAIKNIQIINSLIQGYDPSLPSDFYDNLLIFTFNRKLTLEEYQSLTFKIDEQYLTIESDYKILSTFVEEEKIKLIIWSSQNRKVKQLSVTVLQVKSRYQILNQILVSQEYSKQQSQTTQTQSLTNSLQSITSSFSSNGDSFHAVVIALLKQFQLLCQISNFVQVLPLIYLIRDSLPGKIKFASLLGSSIVFNKNPTASQITYASQQIQDLSNQQLLQNTLQGFGISQDVFQNFAFQFLVIIISTILIIYLISFRISFKGKQYTTQIVFYLLNFLCNYIQSSITAVMFCICFCWLSSNQQHLLILQISAYSFFFVSLFYLISSRSKEFLSVNMPNVFNDIEFKMKGSQSYLIFQYIKKYLVVIIFLTLFFKPFFCAIFTAVVYCITFIYLIKYKFFKKCILNYIKIFQEFVISGLFITIALSTFYYEKEINQDVISNEVLLKQDKLGSIILLIIILCLSMSSLIQLIRIYFIIQDLVKQYKEYKIRKAQEQIESQKLLDLASLSFAKSVKQSTKTDISFQV